MANLIDIIVDYYPPASGVSVPLREDITITFDRLMDEDRLEEDFFLQGPDTDQFVGPGLIEMSYPDNVSQGELDDFLRSPGYQGIVEGTFSFATVDGGTKLLFTPTKPLAALTEYTAYMGETLDANANTISGYVSWPFTTGSGAIQQLPSTTSSSILVAATASVAAATSPLEIVKTTPADLAIEQSTDLREIVVEFTKELDPTSVTDDKITVEAIEATDHPTVSVSATGTLAKEISTGGKILRIRI